MRVSALVEPPWLVFILAGVVHANTRAGIDLTDLQAPVFNPQFARGKIHGVELFIDRHCHTKLPGPLAMLVAQSIEAKIRITPFSSGSMARINTGWLDILRLATALRQK
jgi:hypothetical protein